MDQIMSLVARIRRFRTEIARVGIVRAGTDNTGIESPRMARMESTGS